MALDTDPSGEVSGIPDHRVGDLLLLDEGIAEAGGRLLPEPLNGIPGHVERQPRLDRQPFCEAPRSQRRQFGIGGDIGPSAWRDFFLHRPSRPIVPTEAVRRIAADDFVVHRGGGYQGRRTPCPITFTGSDTVPHNRCPSMALVEYVGFQHDESSRVEA